MKAQARKASYPEIVRHQQQRRAKYPAWRKAIKAPFRGTKAGRLELSRNLFATL